jgi:hypothetical protein
MLLILLDCSKTAVFGCNKAQRYAAYKYCHSLTFIYFGPKRKKQF